MSSEASQNSAKRSRGGHWKPAFLELLRETANVSASAAWAGISRRAVYKAREKSEEFREAWEDALEEATDASKPKRGGGHTRGTVSRCSTRAKRSAISSATPIPFSFSC